MSKDHFIGEVSKKTGVSINTIRYYEHQGLLGAPRRTESGYRMYGEETVEKLLFIKKAQRFGLKLEEIQAIIRNRKKGVGPCCDYLRKLLDRKIAEFDEIIRELQDTRKDLKTLIAKWMPMRNAKKKDYTVCPQIETQASRNSHKGNIGNKVAHLRRRIK